MMKVSLLLLSFVCASIAATPTRPSIPDQFYSEVHLSVNDNGRGLTGGGILATDVPKNMGRTDFRLQNDKRQIETIHILERYDLGEVHEIVDFQACKTILVKGNIQNPFAWVSQASFNGATTFRGTQHDVWLMTTADSNGKYENRLYVDSTNVNVPAYFTVHNVSATKVYDMAIDFLSFKAPESWVFTIPHICDETQLNNGSGCDSAVYWANSNWNCGDVACSYRVPDGSGQPGYECAEFVARSLAAGGFVGLSPTDPQDAYADYNGYNLCLVSSLSSYCNDSGFTAQDADASSVQAAYAIMGDGGDGPWSHACIGVGSGVDDCHNNARQDYPSSGSFFNGVNAVWAPPGCENVTFFYSDSYKR